MSLNMATVQFDHRLITWMLALLIPLFWWRVRTTPALLRRARTGATLLLAMLAVQVTPGICTLLLVVPLPLAAAHQAVALFLFAASLYVAHVGPSWLSPSIGQRISRLQNVVALQSDHTAYLPSA